MKQNIKDIQGQNEKIIEKKSESKNIQQQNIQKENLYKKEVDNLIKNNIIEQLENKPPIYPMLSKFKNTPGIGLANIDSPHSCMNAILQCFSHTAPLTEYFLNPEHKEIITKGKFNNNKNEPRLSEAYYEVVQNLWPLDNTSKAKYFSPNKFKDVLGTLKNYFKKMEAINAKDFIDFFLNQIHKEINLGNEPKKKDTLDSYNRELALNNFINELQESCSSIISDNFHGIYEYTFKCLNCFRMDDPNYILYDYHPYSFIDSYLEGVRKFRDNNISQKMTMNNQMMFLNIGVNHNILPNIDMDPMMMPKMVIDPNYNTNKVTIYDCFNYEQSLMWRDNLAFCNNCKLASEVITGNIIYTLPKILIIILKRYKYKVILDYPLEMDLSNYVISRINNEKYIYSLYGVITYTEDSSKKMHYIATCKSPLDGKWFRYDDENVMPISDLNKEVLNFNTPYILFYQRKK